MKGLTNTDKKWPKQKNTHEKSYTAPLWGKSRVESLKRDPNTLKGKKTGGAGLELGKKRGTKVTA